MMTDIVKKLLINLEVLSNVEERDKIYARRDGSLGIFKHNSTDNNFLNKKLFQVSQAMIRWSRGESRDTAFDILNEIIQVSLLCVKSNENKSEILVALQKSRVGIENIMKTYNNDENIKSKIQVLLNDLDLIIKNNASTE